MALNHVIIVVKVVEMEMPHHLLPPPLKKTETPPVFDLEGEWVVKQPDGTVSNVPVVPKLNDSAPGICLLQDMETVTGLAATLRHSKFPAAVVTPFPVRDGAFPTKHLPIFLKKTVGEVESKVQVMGVCHVSGIH